MANKKISCGGFLIDEDSFDFEDGVLSVKGGAVGPQGPQGGPGPQGPAGPSKQGVAVPDVSGSEASDAITTINALLASLRTAGLIANS